MNVVATIEKRHLVASLGNTRWFPPMPDIRLPRGNCCPCRHIRSGGWQGWRCCRSCWALGGRMSEHVTRVGWGSWSCRIIIIMTIAKTKPHCTGRYCLYWTVPHYWHIHFFRSGIRYRYKIQFRHTVRRSTISRQRCTKWSGSATNSVSVKITKRAVLFPNRIHFMGIWIQLLIFTRIQIQDPHLKIKK